MATDSLHVDGGPTVAEVDATAAAVGVDLGVQLVGDAEQVGQRILTEQASEVVLGCARCCGSDVLGPLAKVVDPLLGDVDERVVRQGQLCCRDERCGSWFGGGRDVGRVGVEEDVKFIRSCKMAVLSTGDTQDGRQTLLPTAIE